VLGPADSAEPFGPRAPAGPAAGQAAAGDYRPVRDFRGTVFADKLAGLPVKSLAASVGGREELMAAEERR